MAGRPAKVYRVDIERLLLAGYVREHISIEGTASYRPHGRLEDIIHGIGWQSDRLNEFDVRPGVLAKLAMYDGLTAVTIARLLQCDIRQAQRYMRKLAAIEWHISRLI